MRRILSLHSCNSSFFHGIACSFIALALFSAFARAAPSEAVRLAVTCEVGGKPAPEIQDIVTANISGDPNVEVIERSRIDLLINEGGLIKNPERRVQLGRFLSLDYFLNFRRRNGSETSGQWTIEAVNAQTGELLASTMINGGSSADIAPILSEQAVKLIHERIAGKPVSKENSVKKTRVAVMDFSTDDPKNVDQIGCALRLSADVREFLSSGKLLVLDRALAQQVARENGYEQEGFIEAKPDRLPMLGADIVVTGKLIVSGTETVVQLKLLSTHEGSVTAAQSFSYDADQSGGSLPEPARKWLVDTLHPARTVERTAEETIQLEALQPFYSGIAKFFAGQPLEATGEFQKAYILNEKFADAMLWEARCYDALGLKPVADAERRYVKVGLTGRGVATTGATNADDAITFLGITSGTAELERAAAENLEMLAVDDLSRGKKRLQLASNLAALRDEYDVLVGTANTRGARWTEAPSFLSNRSLRGELSPLDDSGRRVIAWFLVDNLEGKTFPKTTGTLGSNPGEWRKEIEQEITALLVNAEEPKAATPASLTEAAIPKMAPIPDLENQANHHIGVPANIPLFKVLLADPGNRYIMGRGLTKGDLDGRGMTGFMNFGFRQVLFERMPKDEKKYPWEEYLQLQHFSSRVQTGQYISEKNLDYRAELARFFANHPTDLPGCLAEYTLLFDQLGDIDPGELFERFQRLNERVSGFTDADLLKIKYLKEMTGWLSRTAQVATGKDASLSLPHAPYALPLYFEFSWTGLPRVQHHLRHWIPNEWEKISDTANRAPEEARAALAILGRGDDLRRVKPQWLTDFPNSTVMLAFVIDALYHIDDWLGLPIVYEFDAVAERGHHRNMISYCHRSLLRHLDRAQDSRELDYLENRVDAFTHYLTQPTYVDIVTNDDWQEIRATLATKLDEANKRVSRSAAFKSPFSTNWRTMQRCSQPTDLDDSLEGADVPNEPSEARDELLEKERDAGKSSWKKSPVKDHKWTDLVHSGKFENLVTNHEMARIYLAYLPRFKELFHGQKFSLDELKFMQDYGSTLLGGGETAIAEEVFSRMLESAAKTSHRDEMKMELLANASLEMALISRASGRKAEALDYARRSLDFSLRNGNPFQVVSRIKESWKSEKHHCGQLRALALRLISDLRSDVQSASLPKRVKALVVRTPNLANAEVTFYYRVPPNVESQKSCPVLILAPSQNDGALSYCLDSNPWAQFADEHGLVLLVPQFVNFLGGDYYENVQEWSAKTLLDALENIHTNYHIDSSRLLLHGYGAGASYLAGFARWAPQRCVGLSLHSTGNWPWADSLPGMQPLKNLQGVPCLVTTGEEDSFGCDKKNRLAAAVQWVTMVRGAGVPVLWKPLPGVAHIHDPGMEQMSMAFLSYCLEPTRDKVSFTGDIRSGIYYSADDARVEKIPKNFREDIPTQELAELWGIIGK